MHFNLLIFVSCLAFVVPQAVAQSTGGGSSRLVYKCQVAGKVVYTDEPCLGAERVNVQPTRGLNKSTGRELTGDDVRREKGREQLSEAIRPITGMNSTQYETARTRFQLSAASKAECAALDNSLPKEEAAERSATPAQKATAQGSLLASRKRFRELRC